MKKYKIIVAVISAAILAAILFICSFIPVVRYTEVMRDR